ncbi:GOLPH3/VPS74 family protein [Streptomyces zhihengii]|uniref:GOLPH3/VPS74 family protein n=1 Tax=Streptomyces zhihengii TaxID=1818004 RepID=UPI0033B8F73F
MSVTLAEEIMLLSLDDESGAAKDRASAAWAVAGGLVLDLALEGRVAVEGKRIAVTDPSSTGVPLLDGRLEAISTWSAKRSRPTVVDWLAKDQGKAPDAVLDSLTARGFVREERRAVLGLFPVRRWPEADGTVERELRARLHRVVLEAAEPDPRTVGLVTLLHGARLHRIAFPDTPRKEVEPIMATLAEGQWAGGQVREAIRAMQAAMAAVTVATAATLI